MLTVEQFKRRLLRPNHPDWLLVGVDANDGSQLYILSNGGMANINCAPIELYADEIKHCAQEMILLGELFIKEGDKSLRIGHGRSVYSYSLKSKTNVLEATLTIQNMYFSSTFVRWQRSHELSDKIAQDKLGLTTDEYHQFREDELNITEDLMAKLAEVTGSSIQFWKNRMAQKNRGSKGNNENI
jgi:hypothetical protein